MRFLPTSLPGVILVETDVQADERGSFTRVFCEKEFAAAGITFAVCQANTSFNPHARTLRGMHFQVAPQREAKLVRCAMGSIYDVVVDLRHDSPAYCRWHGVKLSRQNRFALVIPEGCAHGFLTLVPDSEVFYLMSAFYDPSHSSGVRWNDPAFGIEWPVEPAVISPRDTAWENYAP